MRALPLVLVAVLCGCHPCGPDDVCVVAGSGAAGWNGDGLPAEQSWLYLPTDALRGPDGELWIVDYNNYRLRAVVDGTLQTRMGSGMHAYAEVGAPVLASPLENPIAAEVGPDGRIYVAGEHEGRVLVDDGGTMGVIAGTGTLAFSGDGGDPLLAELWDPTGLAFGPDGELYVSDAQTNRVRVIRDGIIDTVLGGGDAADGPGTSVMLSQPQKIAWDGHANRLIVADAGQSRVVAWSPADGLCTVLAGTRTPGILGDGGPAIEAQLVRPVGVAVADDGSIWIADALSNTIRVIGTDGKIDTVLGTGAAAPLDKPMPADEAVLDYPAAVRFDGDDVIIANMLGHQVVRWVDGAP